MGLIHKVRLDEPDFIFHRSVFMRFAASVFRSSWCISFLVILDGKVLLIATLPVFRRHRYWKNSYFQAIFEAWIKNATGGDLRPEKKEIQYRVHNIFYIAIRKFLFFTDIAWSNEGCPFFSLFLLFYNPIPAWHDRLITKSGPMVCPGETPSFHSYKKRTWQARELRALVHFDTLCNAEYLIRIDTYFFDELLCTMLPRYTCLARHSNLGGNTPLDRQQIQDWARTDDLECLHK